MSSSFARSELLGNRLWWLLDIVYAGRTIRLSTGNFTVETEDGELLQYVDGIAGVDFEQAVELFQTSPSESAIPFDVVFDDLDVAELESLGHDFSAATATLSLWREGDTYERRRMIIAGGIGDQPEYGAAGEPVSFSLVAHPSTDDRAIVPAPTAVVDGTTWPHAASAAKGRTYPTVIGSPGYTIDSSGAMVRHLGSPALLVDNRKGAGSQRLLLCDGAVDATTVYIADTANNPEQTFDAIVVATATEGFSINITSGPNATGGAVDVFLGVGTYRLGDTLAQGVDTAIFNALNAASGGLLPTSDYVGVRWESLAGADNSRIRGRLVINMGAGTSGAGNPIVIGPPSTGTTLAGVLGLGAGDQDYTDETYTGVEVTPRSGDVEVISYWHSCAVEIMQDGRGRTVSTCVLPSTGDMRFQQDHEYAASWTGTSASGQTYGCGILRRARTPIRTAGDALLWMFRQSTMALNLPAWETVAAQLQSYRVDFYFDEPVSPWRWAQQNLIPLLPISIDVDGLGQRYPILWRWQASAAEAVATLDTTLRKVERVGRISKSRIGREDVANEIRLEYAIDAMTGQFQASMLGHGDPLLGVDGDSFLSAVAQISRNRWGRAALSETTDMLQDRATAARVVGWWLARKALSTRRAAYRCPNEFRYLKAGDVVTVTDDEVFLDAAVGLVVGIKDSDVDDIEIAVRLLPQLTD